MTLIPNIQKRPSFIDLVSILSVYGISCISIVIFAPLLLKNPFFTASTPSGIALVMIFIAPVFLATLFIISLVRFLNDYKWHRNGARIRSRVIVSFLLIAMMASIPQGLLLVLSTNSIIDGFYNQGTGNAVSGGIDIALEYYGLKTSLLAASAESELPSLGNRLKTNDIKSILNYLERKNPTIVALELYFKPSGELRFSGNENARIEPSLIEYLSSGPLPRESIGKASFIRYLKRVPLGSEEVFVILAAEISEQFESASQALTEAQGRIDGVSLMRSNLKWLILALYLALALPLLFIAMLFGFSASATLVKPVVAVEEGLRRMSSGDFTVRVLSRAGDELADLTKSFNTMAGAMEKSRSSALESQKISTWQEIAQRLAHEIKNPLTPIRLSAERVLRKSKNNAEDLHSIIESSMMAIIQEVDGLTSLLSEFRSFAKLPDPQFDWTNLYALVEETVSIYKSSNPQVIFDYEAVDKDLVLRIDRGHIKQVLSNLIANSSDAMGQNGTLIIRTDLVKKADSRYCKLSISDTGPGIPEDLRKHIFTPYFTTKKHGTGLGLAIVEHIVILHSGTIRFETETGSGTTFIIDLPITR